MLRKKSRVKLRKSYTDIPRGTEGKVIYNSVNMILVLFKYQVIPATQKINSKGNYISQSSHSMRNVPVDLIKYMRK